MPPRPPQFRPPWFLVTVLRPPVMTDGRHLSSFHLTFFPSFFLSRLFSSFFNHVFFCLFILSMKKIPTMVCHMVLDGPTYFCIVTCGSMWFHLVLSHDCKLFDGGLQREFIKTFWPRESLSPRGHKPLFVPFPSLSSKISSNWRRKQKGRKRQNERRIPILQFYLY